MEATATPTPTPTASSADLLAKLARVNATAALENVNHMASNSHDEEDLDDHLIRDEDDEDDDANYEDEDEDEDDDEYEDELEGMRSISF